MEPSQQHFAFTNPQSCFSHICPSHQALQGLAWNPAFCRFLLKIFHNGSHCLRLYSYVNCWGLCPTQHSDATKPKCPAPSRGEAFLFHHFTAVPTALASSTGRHTSFSETNRLPALHSSCSRQPLSIICFPFQPSTSHSFNVSGGLKSICWLPGLCCWKQSRFCYLFQGAGQEPTARGEHQAKRWSFKGFMGCFLTSWNLCLLPWGFPSISRATGPGHDMCSWSGHTVTITGCVNHWAGNDSLLPALTAALIQLKKFNWF